ncbi:MAG: anhydro-N-acetylmuramic acid kinase [Ignavibacteriales bacterium]|nr:anhydro-N-acetylmuramic acid kinase [Ignavibacteriales bacterium]
MTDRLATIRNKKKTLAVGLMSGTSLDGVDAALVEIEGSGTEIRYRLVAFHETPFPEGLPGALLAASESGGGTTEEICELDAILAVVYADAVEAVAKKAGVSLDAIDFVGAHGQTVRHLPEPRERFGVRAASTLQIGNPSALAKRTGAVVVGDFRSGDVALGGQGAPLVPYFDYVSFHSTEKNRALLNLGGVSNITILNKNHPAEKTLAFDCGPGNMLLDRVVHAFFGEPFDRDGAYGSRGEVDEELLDALLEADEFVAAPPPKSTGRERYGESFLAPFRDALGKLDPYDATATLADYTALAVWENYVQHVRDETPIDELFVSGGGARNKAIMNYLQTRFGDAPVENVESLGLSSDAKEAVCFAVLASETLRGTPTNIPRVTGASRATVLGAICLP